MGEIYQVIKYTLLIKLNTIKNETQIQTTSFSQVYNADYVYVFF